MKPASERCTIVMSGAWNPAIFMPEWTATVSRSGKKPTLDLLFGPGGVAYRLDMEDMWLEVLPHQVLLAPQSFTDDAFREMEYVAVHILERLRETPIRAVGVNFGFEVPENAAIFAGLFRPSDLQLLNAASVRVESTTITRKLLIDGLTLNLSARRDGGPPRLDFNYHQAVANATEAKNAIADRVLGLKQNAIQFAETIYELKLEGT